ncbi:SMI1/KNR4 family protein [Virgisporangium aurantiacum]|uniref:SMI1/KNR4 family protein n=1 Tax=Virgisporangium aurantiacum TaxID=175570 RepID=A0A8J3Z744_9ACTN|nr:SMI1/KNR4 family protein [Virgisporangium aurantiacum]
MTFWDPERQHGSQPPLTPEVVADTERTLGVTLPESLLRLLRIRNGGVVADAWDAVPLDGGVDYVPFGEVCGAGPADVPDSITLSDTPYLIGEWGLPSPLVLLSGDGHTWVALDYRACGPAGEPSVVYVDADFEREVPLAPDFRAFVERLVPSSDC